MTNKENKANHAMQRIAKRPAPADGHVRAGNMSLVQRLVGQKVLDGDADENGLHLQLSEAVFVAYNPTTGGSPTECVGASIQAVKVVEKDHIELVFSNGNSINVSLKESDYVGPEAFMITFSDGTIVVEQ